MNKKLIKQLEEVGFVKAKTTLTLKVKGGFICDFFMRNRMLIIYNSEKVSKKYVSCTFEGILLLIKEHTGVDLAKKTKRKEIEELKTGLKALVEKAEDSEAVFDARLKGYFMSIVDTVQEQATKIEILEDAIKSQNDAVEDSRKDAHRANDRLTMVLRRLKVLGVWKDEEPNKQASEMQAEEKKGFEVGDPVVKKGNGAYFRDGDELTIKEKKTDHNCYWCQSKSMPTIEKYVHERNLEHAPAESPKEKAMEFGDWAETLVGKANIPKGSKVLITLRLDTDNDFYCSTGQSDNHFEYYKPEELKPL